MRIFVLSTGRCGSTTFVRACRHIVNYTAEHESRSHLIGDEHFSYPDRHIEVDNRLAWFLGTLDSLYGNSAFYVHLKRDRAKVAESYVNRWGWDISIINAYQRDILAGSRFHKEDRIDVALDLCETIEKNIELFLKDKTKKMEFNLENASNDFKEFWNQINAEGDLDSALLEWTTSYNASKSPQRAKLNVVIKKLRRILDVRF